MCAEGQGGPQAGLQTPELRVKTVQPWWSAGLISIHGLPRVPTGQWKQGRHSRPPGPLGEPSGLDQNLGHSPTCLGKTHPGSNVCGKGEVLRWSSARPSGFGSLQESSDEKALGASNLGRRRKASGRTLGIPSSPVVERPSHLGHVPLVNTSPVPGPWTDGWWMSDGRTGGRTDGREPGVPKCL